MDALSQLEARIDSILAKNRVLEEENRRLRRELEDGKRELETENRTLRDEIERERSAKRDVLAKIDGLLNKLQVETE
ncbi:regulator of replication initiation timing [Desulfobaculum xiamenense]|uniref:Regulator of replication initiation timing n=1 Tax=Desulfobaculum xiamenense TaxID=995050 RepID=A0A846QSM4_9BACT|nr:cell division protein ZapB [Desulfobaculum xiamenense]NJB68174.1 regulator of replication initiation timing [Desulfobaculum xiamenense]